MSKQDHYDLMSAEDKPKRYGGEAEAKPVTKIGDTIEEAHISQLNLAAQDALKALSDAGYVVVPREPTEEMEDAGADAYHTAKKQREPKHAFPAHWLGPVWQAMIAEAEKSEPPDE